ncbi:MAG: 50S ribosomal protein L10 [Thermoleophilaceae bacterium]|nr:50S ribosomal protein L10 [Thermoleophilaceae bacterium]
MNKEQKAAVVEQVAAQIQESEAVFAVDYRGISVQQAAELRERLGDADATLRVVKNTLTRRAVEQAGADSLGELLEGPTAFTFVRGDAALAAKALATFRKENDLLEFKGGTMEGEAVSVEQIEAISRLPGLDALRAQFVGVLASPVTGLVRGLGGLVQGLASQLGQIRDQGLVEGEAPPEQEAPAEEASAAEEAPAEETPAESETEQAASEDNAADEAETDTPSEGEETKEG